MPATTCLALLAALIIAALPHWRPFFIVLKILFVCLAVALLGFLGSAVWNFIQKRLAIGVADLVLFLLCGAAAVVVYGPPDVRICTLHQAAIPPRSITAS